MLIVPLDKTEVRTRQRKKMSTQALNELRDSILLSAGLLHPPVYWFDPSTQTWVLSVGGRRTAAIQLINEMKPVPSFNCGDQTVPPGHIPITPLGDYIDEIGRFEAEITENIYREDLDWRDRAQAIADLHEMRSRQNPRQTVVDTARELAENEAASSVQAGRTIVRDSQIVIEHMANPQVASARNMREALAHVYRQEEQRAIAALAKRRLRDSQNVQDIQIRNADLTILLPLLDSDRFDLIIADPPFGIDAGSGGFRARTVHHHNYEDDPDTAREVARSIITEGFRLAKQRANLFLFCDIDNFEWLKLTSGAAGWVPFRRPLIWQKSETEGLAPWGGQGPRITTEFIFYATKGQRGLHISPTDVLPFKRVPRRERLHGAEKPVELMRRLIECATLPGDAVLDPCCGSGSSLIAAKELKRQALGIEKDPTYYTTAIANVHGAEDVADSSGAA